MAEREAETAERRVQAAEQRWATALDQGKSRDGSVTPTTVFRREGTGLDDEVTEDRLQSLTLANNLCAGSETMFFLTGITRF